MASKTDIEKVKLDLEKVKAELSVNIESSKAELLRWLFGVWATLFLAIFAIFLKLP